VVENTQEFVDLVVAALTPEGFAIEVARDGPAGIELARTVRPDVVVLDITPGRLRTAAVRHHIHRTREGSTGGRDELGQDGENRKGVRMSDVSSPAPEPWDAERELAHERGVERRLVWKELAVIAGLLGLLALRVLLAR